MKRTFIKIAALGCLLAAGGIARAQDTNAAPALDLKSFDLIATRNIFDQNRRPPRIQEKFVQPKRIDTFTLVGTMSYEKGQFAFFDSNRSEYRKALKASETIAGYKIAEIAPDGIKLAAASNKTINLPVGTQMRRVEGGRWSFAGRAEIVPEAPPTTAATVDNPGTATAPDSAPEAPAGAGDNDVMKRLMLKRLQEK
jgi:hypothetical protein